MSFSRRTFLAGAAAGVTTLVLAACTPRPTPTASTTAAPPPLPTTGPVPTPAALLRSDWAGDDFARGSHSFLAAHSSPVQRATLREPLDYRIFFAGEATSVDAPGTVHGAVDSGVRAAAEVYAVAAEGERVAVIGAGAAGAAAGDRLRDYGFEVTVIEARERSGGRIDTRALDEWPVPIELGAGWAPPADSSPAGRLDALGILTVPVEGDRALRTADGSDASASDSGAAAITTAVQWAAQQPDDSSLSEAIEGAGVDVSDGGDPPTAADRVQEALRTEIEIGRGADPAALSAWYGLEEAPAPTAARVTGGYGAYVDDLLDGLDVWLSTPVTAISYNDNGVSVRLATGEAVSVDRVVLTVPLGVLKGQGIAFDPPLSFERRAAVADLGYGATDTVWVRFDEPFWQTDAVRWSVLGSDLAVTEWLNLEPLVGEPILVGLVAGEQAAALAALDDAAVTEAVVASLEPFAAR